MSIKEKVAYLKGLAEGLGLDQNVKTEKLISAIIDTLAVVADEVEELNENALDIGEELDAISDDLAEVEEFLFGDDDDNEGFDFDDDDNESDDDCDCSYCNGASLTYEISCPACGAKIELNESDLASDSITCEKCCEELEFDFDEYSDDEDEDEKAP